MNAFLVYDHIKKRHKNIIESKKLIEINWRDVFMSAEHSVFLCGGEMRTAAKPDIATEYMEVLRGKFDSNPEFKVSVMCGSWIYAESEPTGNESAFNATLKGLHQLAQEKAEADISFYVNHLNVVESADSGYLHNVVIDEEMPTQQAYLEIPHGCPKEGSERYKFYEWITSNNEAFVWDVINTREKFRTRWGVKAQRAGCDDTYEEVKSITIEDKDFYRVTKKWNFRTYFGYSVCLKRWLSGRIDPPLLPVQQ